MPRSLLLTYDFPPMSGGIARMTGEWARHAGGTVVVSTGRVPGGAAYDRNARAVVARVAVPSNRLRTLAGLLRWAWRADELARQYGVEFLWAGNIRPAGRVARWIARRQRLSYGLVAYGLDVALLAQRAAGPKASAIRRIVGDSAGIVAISRWTASRVAELCAELGMPGARILIVPPGVDTGRFRPDLPTNEVREQYNLTPRRWLLTVARLMPHKGIDTGLEALAGLRAAGRDVGYIVAGDGPARADLMGRATRLGVEPFVRWCGFVPDDQLPALYSAADIYLGLSRAEGSEVEGFGLALLEAQAAGLPVVAGADGGTADALEPGVTGFLVPPRSRSDIHLALMTLLDEPVRARAMGAAGRERAEREGSWSRVAGRFEAAAEEFRAVARPARPAGR